MPPMNLPRGCDEAPINEPDRYPPSGHSGVPSDRLIQELEESLRIAKRQNLPVSEYNARPYALGPKPDVWFERLTSPDQPQWCDQCQDYRHGENIDGLCLSCAASWERGGKHMAVQS